MEPNQIAKNQEHHGKILLKSSPQIITKENNDTSMSVYVGCLNQETFAQNVAKIKMAFPELDISFYKILKARIIEKGFSDQRLSDAVNHLIDTCQYPTPTLANILSFDKRVKVYSYHDLCTLIGKNEAIWGNYARILVAGKPFFVRKDEKEMFNIPNEF